MITKLESRLTIAVIVLISITFWLFVTIVANAFHCFELNSVQLEPFRTKSKPDRLKSPFVYSLVIHTNFGQGEDIYLCDVSVLNPFWAVTAATCVFVHKKHPRDYVAIKANPYTESRRQEYLINKILIHKNHKDATEYNIAFLKVFRPLINSELTYLRLAKLNYKYSINSSVDLLSFGLQNKDSSLSNNNLKNISLLLLDERYCLQKLKKTKSRISGRGLCIGNYGTDMESVCKYGYGTPIIQNGLLIGIVSNGTTCDSSDNMLGLFLKLSYYGRFQNSLMKNQERNFLLLPI